MPAFDQVVNSVDRPWLVTTYTFNGSSGSPSVTITDQNSGYPSLPCRNFRTTTDRNPYFTGKAYRSKFRQKIFEWYKRKPPPVRLAGKDKTLRKELITDRMDWRRSRPVRVPPKPSRIPEGWVLQLLPNGKLRLRSLGYDPRSKISRYEWVPEVVNSLRPSNRKWTRHSNRVPIDANVNDLEYFQQTGWVDGVADFVVHNSTTPPVINQTYPDPGVTTFSGSFRVLGHSSFVPWTEYGYSTDYPFSSIAGLQDDRAAEDPAALLARWQDEIAAVSRIALRRHYVKLKRQKVDLATALGEGLKTVNSISQIAGRIGKSLLFLKKGRLAEAYRQLFPTSPKGLANDYLAWKYGIKPLIGDLQGAAEHLVEFITRATPLKSNGHAKDRFEKINSSTIGSFSSFGSSGVYEVRKAIIRVKYGTSFSIPSKIKRQAASLGFTNPANVTWELLPFSFVVDWFLPIGEFLSSLSSLHGLVVKESYKTVFIREELTRYTFLRGFNGAVPSEKPVFPTPGSDRGSSGYVHLVGVYNELHRETIYCKREVIPLENIPLPRLQNPISAGHLRSAMALFTQLVSK